MKVTTNLPPEIKDFRYVKNHHFIELEDVHGNKAKLNAGGILVGACESCKAQCLATSNEGAMKCTHCGGSVKWAWSKPQLAFIPEHESEFMGMDAARNPPKSGD